MMTLDELLAQTIDLDTIHATTVAHWAVLYTIGNDMAAVHAAIARERCRRAMLDVIRGTHRMHPDPVHVMPAPVSPVSAQSIRRWRAAQAAGASHPPKPSTGRRSQ
jgi:hypothetical protein